jgi:hypothetical protein
MNYFAPSSTVVLSRLGMLDLPLSLIRTERFWYDPEEARHNRSVPGFVQAQDLLADEDSVIGRVIQRR